MARETLSMRKIQEVIRLSQQQSLSVRAIARSCRIASSTVADYLRRAKVAGVSWPFPEGMNEKSLEKALFPRQPGESRPAYVALDMAYIRRELARPHVTMQLLWEEYRHREPEGYSYSQYCQRYRDWVGTLALSLRQEHRAGRSCLSIMRATRSASPSR